MIKSDYLLRQARGCFQIANDCCDLGAATRLRRLAEEMIEIAYQDDLDERLHALLAGNAAKAESDVRPQRTAA